MNSNLKIFLPLFQPLSFFRNKICIFTRTFHHPIYDVERAFIQFGSHSVTLKVVFRPFHDLRCLTHVQGLSAESSNLNVFNDADKLIVKIQPECIHITHTDLKFQLTVRKSTVSRTEKCHIAPLTTVTTDNCYNLTYEGQSKMNLRHL